MTRKGRWLKHNPRMRSELTNYNTISFCLWKRWWQLTMISSTDYLHLHIVSWNYYKLFSVLRSVIRIETVKRVHQYKLEHLSSFRVVCRLMGFLRPPLPWPSTHYCLFICTTSSSNTCVVCETEGVGGFRIMSECHRRLFCNHLGRSYRRKLD